MRRIEFHAMGSRILVLVDTSSDVTETALQQVPVWFEEWEQVLSRFRPESELSQLNRSTGQPVLVSKTLWDVFQTAQDAEQFTNGLVTPTVLDSLILAGYDRSFELMPDALPSLEALAFVPDPTTTIGCDAIARTLFVPEATHLDLGGVTKGWAAHQAALRLSEFGSALVDAGGDIAISGPRPGGDPWPVGINDPVLPGTYFEVLQLESGGVATSGKDYHRWLQGGTWQHHIIDPRTGLSATTDVLSATILAPTVLEAEAAAKAVIILGSEDGMDWLEADPSLAGVLVLDNSERLYSHKMDDYLWREK